MDCGGENVKIERFINQIRSDIDKPFIKGTSVHNVRIERLWRDVYQQVICFYQNMFINLEKEKLLD